MRNSTLLKTTNSGKTNSLEAISSAKNFVESKLQVVKPGSSDELKKILAYSPDVIMVINENEIIEQVSAASFTMWNIEPAEMLGKKFIHYILPDDLESTITASVEVRTGIKITMFQNSVIHKNGGHVPMLWSARWDANEKKMYCVGRDASEKIKMEKAFMKEQQRFNEMFYKAPASICILKGRNHTIEIANSNFYERTEKKNIIGKTVAEVFPEFKEQGLFEMLDNVFATGKTFVAKEKQVKIKKENGEVKDGYYDFIYQAHRNNLGEVEGIFYFGHDVTEQVLSRKKIEESERQYFDLIQNLPAAIYTCDAEGYIKLYNKAAVKLWGRQPEAGKEKWNGAHEIYTKEGLMIPHEIAPMAQSIKTGKAVNFGEMIIKQPGGNFKNIIAHPTPVFNGEGNITGAVNMLIDITEKKHLEKQLLNEQLNKQKEITKAAINAQEKERRGIGEELHDNVNQILAASKLYLTHSLTREDDYKPFVIKTQEYITEAIEEIRKLTKALVGPAKEEAMGLVVTVTELLSNISTVKDIEFSFKHSSYSEEKTEAGLKVVIYRIIQEQINNILKHADATSVAIDLVNEPEGLRLVIKDNGKGFNTYDLKNGIGLKNIKNRAEIYDGDIEIISSPGNGCTLKVTFTES